jgi:phosphoserine phosphatase
VRTATVTEIVARIDEEAARAPGGALAFDGDGTLWSGDVGDDFFAALLASKRITRAAHDALITEAVAEGVDAEGSASDVGHRIHKAYLAGRFPEERVCEIMTWAFAGWSRADLDAFADDVVRDVGLAGRLHGEALRVIEHATSRGIDVFVVSASPRAVVHAAARVVGVDVARVVSATERVDGEMVVTEVHRPIPYGPGKVTRLREKLGARPLYGAFGDNAFDVALLRESRVPVAIRPKARLVERAAEIDGLVVLERVERAVPA